MKDSALSLNRKAVGVIPARWESSRFPGKPLQHILGKPMIQWVVEGARKSKLLSEVWVATDDERIGRFCDEIKVPWAMTSSNLASGSDRIYEALKQIEGDIVINIQGDEPLISDRFIDPLVRAHLDENELDMSTLAEPLLQGEIENPHSVKVIKGEKGYAIYFSRFPVPFSRRESHTFSHPIAFKHIGIYGYTRKFLKSFCDYGPCPLELAESLEQLRALHLGAQIKVILVEKGTQGVDTPEDLKKVEKMLRDQDEVHKNENQKSKVK